MKIRYLGPCPSVEVVPYGEHHRGETREYPDDFATALLATSKKQRFALAAGKPPAPEPEPETGEPDPSDKKAKRKR